MATPNTNWVYDKGIVNEKDRAALAKAKRLESRQASKGYRWVKVNARTKLFVECDADGIPTEHGRRQIENLMLVL